MNRPPRRRRPIPGEQPAQQNRPPAGGSDIWAKHLEYAPTQHDHGGTMLPRARPRARHQCTPPASAELSIRTHGAGAPPHRLPAGQPGDLWRCLCGNLWHHRAGNHWQDRNALASWLEPAWVPARWWHHPVALWREVTR